MIEMDQTEHAQSTVTDEVLHLVRLFNDHETGDKLLYRWQDVDTYSDELQEVIQIVTGGLEPGRVSV